MHIESKSFITETKNIKGKIFMFPFSFFSFFVFTHLGIVHNLSKLTTSDKIEHKLKPLSLYKGKISRHG